MGLAVPSPVVAPFVFAMLALTACGGGSSPDEPVAKRQGPASPSASAAGGCEPLDPIVIAALVQNTDTGGQRVPGKIGKAAAVLSPEPGVAGKQVYVFGVTIGEDVAFLAKAVGPGQGAKGSGLYAALDPFSEKASGFFQNEELATGAAAAVETVRACLA